MGVTTVLFQQGGFFCQPVLVLGVSDWNYCSFILVAFNIVSTLVFLQSKEPYQRHY